MRRVLVIVAVIGVLALGFLWVGSAHRDRCMQAGNVGCSMLPWSGHHVSPYLVNGWGQ